MTGNKEKWDFLAVSKGRMSPATCLAVLSILKTAVRGTPQEPPAPTVLPIESGST